MRRVLLAVAATALSPLAHAEAPTGGEIAVEVDLRDQYLLGHPLLVSFTVTNEGTREATFPDLSKRPHLVRFDLVLPDGGKQARLNTAPDEDPDIRWTLPPGGQRQVLLEIPSSGRLPVGAYELRVTVGDEAGRIALDPYQFHLVAPRPVAGSGPFDAPTAEKVGLQAAWLHQSDAGGQLYLLQTEAHDPRRILGNYHLLDLPPGAVDPVLAWSVPTTAWSRHVYWQSSDRSFEWVQLDGPGRAASSGRADVPWPRVRPLGTGVTDRAGTLHIPIWIPSPSGKGGEVRILSATGRGAPQYHRVVRLEHELDAVTTGVDNSSNVRLVLHHGGKVDLYTLDPLNSPDLPPKGRRLLQSTVDATPIASRFAILPETGPAKGGFALFVLEELPRGEAQPRRVRGRWLSTTGAVLHTTQTVDLPVDQPITDLLPSGADRYAALLGTAGGPRTAWVPGTPPRTLDAHTDPELIADSAGQIWLRSWAPDQIVTVQRLTDAGR